MNTVLAIRPWFELAYFAAGVILAFSILVAARQVQLLKRDIQLRVDRAAKEKALESVARYNETCIPLLNAAYHELKAKDMEGFKGKIGSFARGELSPPQLKRAVERMKTLTWLPALNALDVIALAFTSGVADEHTGFESIGRSYCTSVESFYDVLTGIRNDAAYPHYEAICRLYMVWAPRLNKAELAQASSELERQMAAINEGRLTSPPKL